MAKRVLGNDPFGGSGTSGGGDEPPEDEKKSGGSARTSKVPARPSVRPSKAPAAKRGSGAVARGAGSRSVALKPEPESTPDAVVSAMSEPPVSAATVTESATADEERSTAPEEAAAPADLPPDLQRAPESEPPLAARVRMAPGTEVKAEIRDLEAELDRLLEKVSEKAGGQETLGRVAERLRAKIEREPETVVAEPVRDEANVFDVARELLSSDYYLRQWGRVAMRDRSEDVDEFGLDPKFEARCRPMFDFLYDTWWRVETHDIDRVPPSGRVILCANHSGALPYDGAMLATALRREHPTRRELRWLAEDFVFHMPFLGVFMNRIGAVRACQENAERLLAKSACVGVFPEGVKGVAKPYRERYRLQRFGRGGVVKLAIRTRTPIVPVAILGAEEAHPMLAPTGFVSKFLGLPYMPITPTFPWLGPLGLVPLPSKWKMFFLDPIAMEGYAPDAADDEVLVGRLNEKIRGIIQEELDRALRDRRSVLKG